jgi:multidrug efflux pump subunit AcrB
MRVNGAEAAHLGLAPTDVGDAVGAALLGAPAGTVRAGDRVIGVRVRAPDDVRFDPLRLRSLPVFVPGTRRTTPLGSLATFTPTESRLGLDREDQQPLVDMTADVSGRSLGSVVADVQRVLARLRPPPGVRVVLGGQYASEQDAFRALLLVLGLAAVSVCGVMVVQFQSFLEPLVVLLVAPVSFTGALVLLGVTGTPLSVSSFMGLILLVGLIVKNGIILLDLASRRMRAHGLTLEQALREAGQVRLRPILMTTLCTLFGLLPLALGLGAGSELQRPLALAVIGGLALSTPITLFAVPTLLVALRGRDYRPAEN